jgi:hypothetical protein
VNFSGKMYCAMLVYSNFRFNLFIAYSIISLWSNHSLGRAVTGKNLDSRHFVESFKVKFSLDTSDMYAVDIILPLGSLLTSEKV